MKIMYAPSNFIKVGSPAETAIENYVETGDGVTNLNSLASLRYGKVAALNRRR